LRIDGELRLLDAGFCLVNGRRVQFRIESQHHLSGLDHLAFHHRNLADLADDFRFQLHRVDIDELSGRQDGTADGAGFHLGHVDFLDVATANQLADGHQQDDARDDSQGDPELALLPHGGLHIVSVLYHSITLGIQVANDDLRYWILVDRYCFSRLGDLNYDPQCINDNPRGQHNDSGFSHAFLFHWAKPTIMSANTQKVVRCTLAATDISGLPRGRWNNKVFRDVISTA